MTKESIHSRQSLLSKAQETILNSTFIGTLSTIHRHNGFISSNPVAFVWNGESVGISTLKSRLKYKNLVANPTATLCVIAPDDHMKYIEIRGTVKLVDDPDKSFFREAFFKNAGIEPPEDLDSPGAERVTIFLHPQHVSSPKLYGGQFDVT